VLWQCYQKIVSSIDMGHPVSQFAIGAARELPYMSPQLVGDKVKEIMNCQGGAMLRRKQMEATPGEKLNIGEDVERVAADKETAMGLLKKLAEDGKLDDLFDGEV
jgi:hypothetical protein